MISIVSSNIYDHLPCRFIIFLFWFVFNVITKVAVLE